MSPTRLPHHHSSPALLTVDLVDQTTEAAATGTDRARLEVAVATHLRRTTTTMTVADPLEATAHDEAEMTTVGALLRVSSMTTVTGMVAVVLPLADVAHLRISVHLLVRVIPRTLMTLVALHPAAMMTLTPTGMPARMRLVPLPPVAAHEAPAAVPLLRESTLLVAATSIVTSTWRTKLIGHKSLSIAKECEAG